MKKRIDIMSKLQSMISIRDFNSLKFKLNGFT